VIRDLLDSPFRGFARKLFATERMTVGELDARYEDMSTALPATIGDLQSSATVAGAVKLGATEGIAARFFTKVERLGPKQAPPSLLARYQRLENKASSYLALAGLMTPIDAEALEGTIDLVVAQAKANKHRLGLGQSVADFPKLDDFASMAEALLGINQGRDQVVEVRVVDWSPKAKKNKAIELHAFDKAGFHVLEAELSKAAPGVLYVDCLKASHGRNCDEIAMDFGGRGMPGRGNAALVGAGLEAVMVHAVRHGVYAIRTRPGSPMVASLYMKMGFTEPGSDTPFSRRRIEWLLEQLPILSEGIAALNLIREQLNVHRQAQGGADPHTDQTLDLTNPEAVRQALVAFRLSRAAVTGVPRGVAAKLVAMGKRPPRPGLKRYAREIPESASNVRVIRG
jgi:hypothetical protein